MTEAPKSIVTTKRMSWHLRNAQGINVVRCVIPENTVLDDTTIQPILENMLRAIIVQARHDGATESC